jgi:hypothetical protein
MTLAQMLAALSAVSIGATAIPGLLRPKSRKDLDVEYNDKLQQKRDALKRLVKNPEPIPTPKPSSTPTTYNLDEVEQQEFDRLGMKDKSAEEQEEFKQYFKGLRDLK